MGLPGCLERRLAPIDPDLGIAETVRLANDAVADVDLLLVVDDSNSMEEEQRNLARRVEALVTDLVAPPDADGDRVPDWNAVRSLRVGIASTDLGTRGLDLPSTLVGTACTSGPGGEAPFFGHDGRLEPSGTCGSSSGVMAWNEGDDPSTFSAEVACVVESLGVGGCGVEQQAGAAERALERRRGTDFPRPSSVLAVLILTDEEDCTLADPEAFYAAMDGTNRNVLCQRSETLLTSIETLAEDLRGDRPESRFVLGLISGVPTELSGASPAAVLAHPDMAYAEVTGARGLVPRPVCSVEGLGDASPARRLVALAEALGTERVHSICTDDFGPAIADLTSRIGRALDGACLARRVAPGPDGTIQCTLEELLPVGLSCTDQAGRTWLRTDDRGREVCTVAQATASGSPGWRYDPSDARCARIEYTGGAAPPLGTELEVSCWFPIDEDEPGILGP
jgi:hypothetical protein